MFEVVIGVGIAIVIGGGIGHVIGPRERNRALAADLQDALDANEHLANAYGQVWASTSTYRVATTYLASALGHSLNGNQRDAWALLGELGDTQDAQGGTNAG